MDTKTIKDKKARRSEISKGTYQREKQKRDRVLIRLDKGQAAILDAFCEQSGISRSAFFRRHLDAYIAAAGGLAAPPKSQTEPTFLASEFDELFSSSKGA
ncbi:ribbon-helix-helix protein, CopG family [Acidovorax soli]|uniref:Ribbon-helix-helix protein, copG family n=1 Tax=Acidovorax soli TaxID=592050 RepID=A0A1H4B5Z7_9BURK|nr:ribbon-helix-helix protein, CopG family [Acidovorax soli]SEA43551.1 Ribbon-helix-helix protein, copG family [Acidovorax soli]